MNRLNHLFIRGVFILSFGLSMIMVLHPDVRTAVKGRIKPEDRSVLSVAMAQFETGIPYRIVKVRTSEGIQLELYRSPQDSRVNLIDRVDLLFHKDAHFNFSGGTTNLAVDDINGDGQPEIIVPTLDKQLVAHLAVFQFDLTSKKLKRLLPDEIKY